MTILFNSLHTYPKVIYNQKNKEENMYRLFFSEISLSTNKKLLSIIRTIYNINYYTDFIGIDLNVNNLLTSYNKIYK